MNINFVAYKLYTVLAAFNFKNMFDLPIIVRVIIVVCLSIIGGIVSWFTGLNAVDFCCGVVGYQLIDGIIAYFRFR